MDCVYVLRHVQAQEGREDDVKFIGVYRTDEDARAAIGRLRTQPGFRWFVDGFEVEKYELNKDHWVEGFVSAIHHPDGTITYENE